MTKGIDFTMSAYIRHEPTTLPIEFSAEDEYGMDTLCGHMEEHRRMMVRAEYGGCGKSYARKTLELHGHKVLFVCPTSRLSANYKEHGCTLNMSCVFGIGPTEGPIWPSFDDSCYDAIVFDETLFCSARHMARTKRYCESNPVKVVIATGDTRQLERIDCITNHHDYDKYHKRRVDLILSARMFCKENNRLGSNVDKDTLKLCKQG